LEGNRDGYGVDGGFLNCMNELLRRRRRTGHYGVHICTIQIWDVRGGGVEVLGWKRREEGARGYRLIQVL
jgi:hypothetical protein